MADKDKQPKQADFDKAWDNMHKGKGRLPEENDMGPLPPAKKEQVKKGLMEGLKGYSPSKEVSKFDENYKKGGKVKCMSKGGKTSQLAKANGIAVRGKSRGKIC